MRTSRSALAVGAALLGCGLASAAHGQALAATSLMSMTGTLGDGVDSYTNSHVTPTSLLVSRTYATSTATGGWMYAYNAPGPADLLSFGVEFYSSGSRTVTGSGSFTVVFSSDVVFSNATEAAFGLGTAVFSIGATVLNEDDRLASGLYTINWIANRTGSGFTFHASASFVAVPLPGAAALAAAGILGTARRRRR